MGLLAPRKVELVSRALFSRCVGSLLILKAGNNFLCLRLQIVIIRDNVKGQEP